MVCINARESAWQEMEHRIEEAGLDLMDYDNRCNRYRIRPAKGDADAHLDLFEDLLHDAYLEHNR